MQKGACELISAVGTAINHRYAVSKNVSVFAIKKVETYPGEGDERQRGHGCEHDGRDEHDQSY